MNCHSFCVQNPEKMIFHLRAKHAGTILVNNDNIRKLETKTEQTMSALVYPYWHPSGKYIAFSVNDTKQLFHTNHANRIEVMDLASEPVGVFPLAEGGVDRISAKHKTIDTKQYQAVVCPQKHSTAFFTYNGGHR